MHAKSTRLFFAKTSYNGLQAQLLIETVFPFNVSWGRPTIHALFSALLSLWILQDWPIKLWLQCSILSLSSIFPDKQHGHSLQTFLTL